MKKNNVCGNSEGGHTNQVLAVCFATITIVITCLSPVKSKIRVTSFLLILCLVWVFTIKCIPNTWNLTCFISFTSEKPRKMQELTVDRA